MQKVSSLRGSLQSQRLLLLVVLLAAILDQLSKLWVRKSLILGESCPAEGFLRLTHVGNEGIVFGLSVPEAFGYILPVLVVAAALFLLHRYDLLGGRLAQLSVGLFVGGSLGNLIDRIRLGHVTDFIDFNLWGDFHWPAFNLADVAIVVGIALLIWLGIRLAATSRQG
jgi:signal peptidase II